MVNGFQVAVDFKLGRINFLLSFLALLFPLLILDNLRRINFRSLSGFGRRHLRSRKVFCRSWEALSNQTFQGVSTAREDEDSKKCCSKSHGELPSKSARRQGPLLFLPLWPCGGGRLVMIAGFRS